MQEQTAGLRTSHINVYDSYLKGGGEMGELIRNFNWSATSIGMPGEWPQNLLTTISIILHSNFPMFLWWGDDMIQFYNNAYRLSLGNEGKHPKALGQKGKDCWTEIWSFIYPLIIKVKTTGVSTWTEEQLIPLKRNGKIEDVYWTYSYSLVAGENNKNTGVLVTCVETTQKVNNLKQLQESKDQLNFAVEAAELGTWDLNPFTNKISCNNRMKVWFGLKPDAEIELPLALALIADKDRQRVTDAVQSALEYSSGGNYNIEYTIIHPHTKEEKVVKAKGKATFNEHNTAYRFNGTLQDITEETKAKKAITDSEQRLRSVVENAPFPIGVYIGTELRIALANQAIINVWGKGNEVAGKLYREILPEFGNQEIFQQLDHVLSTGIPFHAKNQRVDIEVNGKLETFYFNYSFTPLHDASGKVYGVMNTAADVTDLNVAKQKLEESEERFRTMAEGTEVLITVSDETGNAIYFNKAWTNLTGRPTAELLQSGWIDLVHIDDRSVFVNKYSNAFAKKQVLSEEFRILNKEGEYRLLLAKGLVRLNSDGSFAGYIKSCLDITEQKQFAEELEKKVAERTKELAEANLKLTETNAELNQFAYIASHDLQEPLRKVRTFTDMMEKNLGEVPEKASDYITKIKYSAERMQNLINDILKFSMLSKEREQFEEVDMNDILQNVLGDFELLIEQKQAKIYSDALPVIQAIPIQMRQLINNLIANSLKFNSPERQIEIIIKAFALAKEDKRQYYELDNDQLYYQFEFRDNGVGFKQEYAIQIFTMFQRLHSHKEFEGTGIGLAMCKKIVQNHHGIIYANSSPDKGSEFIIILPRHQRKLS